MVIAQAYILCGGLGTRLGSMTKDTPKPMLPVGGRPILEHTMELLGRHGFEKALLVAGYKADIVREFFEGREWDIDVEVFAEEELAGTAGSMPLLRDKLDDDFLMVYGDVFLDFDVRALTDDHEEHAPLATFLTGPSTHPWDSDLIEAERGTIKGFVGKHDHEPGKHYRNIGNKSVYVLSRRILEYIQGKSDFMKDVFPAALEAGETLRTHDLDPGQFVRDMGRPERFGIVERYLEDRAAIEEARAHPKGIRCVFLDRDGTISVDDEPVCSSEEVEILPGAKDAIRLFNEKGIKVIVTTNQAKISRGLCTAEDHERVVARFKEELGDAHWNGYYFCPHHPETHHGEGIVEMRRACDCRKPAPGMLLAARREHDLDLAECAMIGDSWRDVLAGRNAGVRTVLLMTGTEDKRDANPDYTFDTLLDAAKAITGGALDT